MYEELNFGRTWMGLIWHANDKIHYILNSCTGEYIIFLNPEISVRNDTKKWQHSELWICLKLKIWTFKN